jgi:hypothetical protein
MIPRMVREKFFFIAGTFPKQYPPITKTATHNKAPEIL